MKKINKFIILIILFSLTSCTIFNDGNKKYQNDKNNTTQSTKDISQQEYNQSLKIIQQSPKIIGTINHNNLSITDPISKKSLPIHFFSENEGPTSPIIYPHQFDSSKNWVAWYSPKSGMLALNIKKNIIKKLHPASSFLNTNPYLEFSKKSPIVLFITKDGNILKKINLLTDEEENISIPYPYGNLFKLSPNEEKILFIAGFGQSQGNPQYLFTDSQGNLIKQITTLSNIADRHMVAWMPDSSGMLQVQGTELILYPIDNLDNPINLFSIPTGKHIIDIKVINDNVFLLNDRGYWHIYSISQDKEIARTPQSIASEIKNPKFIPWNFDEFIIREKIEKEDLTYSRFWKSNFKGKKEIILDKFDEQIIKTEPLVIE